MSKSCSKRLGRGRGHTRACAHAHRQGKKPFIFYFIFIYTVDWGHILKSHKSMTRGTLSDRGWRGGEGRGMREGRPVEAT